MSDTSHLIFVRDGRNGRIRQIPGTDLANLQAEHTAWEEISAEDAQADARYIRNAFGAVHSIPSVDLADALAIDGTEEITAEQARQDAPELFGGVTQQPDEGERA